MPLNFEPLAWHRDIFTQVGMTTRLHKACYAIATSASECGRTLTGASVLRWEQRGRRTRRGFTATIGDTLHWMSPEGRLLYGYLWEHTERRSAEKPFVPSNIVPGKPLPEDPVF